MSTPTQPHAVICSSLRNRAEIAETAAELWREGYSVIGPAKDPNRTKEEHAARHRRFIDAADLVVVVSREGYIGDATRGEMEYAAQQGKAMRYRDFPAQAVAESDKLWFEAIDWLINSRFCGEPVIQDTFWGIVDARISREEAQKR